MTRPTDPPPSETMRKQPVQERAQRTIEAIFDATAQIVDTEGEAGLTTNKVARRAGFSIGTLYQYFPSKEAILSAMIRRQREQVQIDIQAMLDDAVARQRPVPGVVRDLVRMLVASFGAGPAARRAMVRLGWRLDHHDNIAQALREGAERNAVALAQLTDPRVRPPTPAVMFVATRAVMGAIRSASLEASPLLGTRAFEDELVRMVWGLLAVRAEVPDD
jgi:AcrR family transcriptional regulator